MPDLAPAAAHAGRPTIVASVLPVDFARLGDEVIALEKGGVDRIQWDVMDGDFVPNITFGPDVIAATRSLVTVGFEAHLMVEHPESMLPRWIEAGCELLIVHAETCKHLHRTLDAIRELGAKAAVALNPATPLVAALEVLDLIDLLLIMTVNPGFGGQRYIASMEPKIAAARAEIDRRGLPIALEVDGGIGLGTIGGAAAAGADTFVTGSSLFTDEGSLADRVSALRAAAIAGS
jgi:ribulose-phosphate 3-epimerase